MTDDKLIWPSKLHHLSLCTGQLPEMIAWYRDIMEMTPEDMGGGITWMNYRGGQNVGIDTDTATLPDLSGRPHYITNGHKPIGELI